MDQAGLLKLLYDNHKALSGSEVLDPRIPSWDRCLQFHLTLLQRQRLKHSQLWMKQFRKASHDGWMGEIELYNLPLQLGRAWHQAFRNTGLERREKVALSLFHNHDAHPLVAVLGDGVPSPPEYRLLTIRRSRRRYILVPGQGLQAILELLDYEVVRSDKVYGGVRLGKGGLSRFLRQHFPIDDHVLQSLTAPLASAPRIVGGRGGVSIASLQGGSLRRFELEFFAAIEAVTPPEYRPPPAKPARAWRQLHPGAEIRYRVDPPLAPDVVRTSAADSFRAVAETPNGDSAGESSQVSLVRESAQTRIEVAKELLYRFSATADIATAKSLQEALAQSIDVQALRREAGDEVHGEIAFLHHHQPTRPGDELEPTLKRLHGHFDTVLSDVLRHSVTRTLHVQRMIAGLRASIPRMAQSFARLAETETTGEDELRRAQGLVRANLEDLMADPRIDFVRKELAPAMASRGSVRYQLVQSHFVFVPKLSTDDLWNAVEPAGVFRDRDDLVGLLEEIHRRGYLVRPALDRWQWISGGLRRGS